MAGRKLCLETQFYLGTVGISKQSDDSGEKTHRSKIAGNQLLETNKDTAIPIDFVEETFNQIVPFCMNVFVCSLDAMITSKR